MLGNYENNNYLLTPKYLPCFKPIFSECIMLLFNDNIFKKIWFLSFLAQRNGPDYDVPPPYQPPTSSWYAAPPPAYQAAPSGYYGWMPPTNAFPDTPPGYYIIVYKFLAWF